MSNISNALLDLNIVKMNKGGHAALLERASQFIVTGILVRLGFRVSVAGGSGGPYDLIVPAYEDFDLDPTKIVLLRAQTRTVKRSLSFIAGIRAGVNRTYKAGVKVYKYTEEHNELIIGVDEDSLNLYLVPTRHIQKWGNSKSKAKLQTYKNNWDILLHWNDAFLKNLEN